MPATLGFRTKQYSYLYILQIAEQASLVVSSLRINFRISKLYSVHHDNEPIGRGCRAQGLRSRRKS